MMFNRSSIAALSAAMMLTLSACSGGAQVSAESSASTSASAESASAEASATPTPTPSPTPTGPSGSEIVLVRPSVDTNNDSKEAEKAALVAAYAVLDQYLRVKNAWVHGDLEHTSDEELLQYVDKRILESVKKQVESMRELATSTPVEGDIIFRDVRLPSIYSLEHSDGSKPSQPNAGIAVTFCEDTRNVRLSDGSRLNVSQTRRIFIVRRDDGAYVLGTIDIDHKGCDYEEDEVV